MMAASFSGGDAVMLVVIFLLLCASGFFALAETALVRTSRQRAEGLRQSGEAKARQVDALVGLVEHVDVDRLALRKRADERRHRRLDAREHAGPAVAVVRPGQPGRLVRLPLGGQAVSS